MGQSLYLECSSGISGDMTVASLLELGADREALLRALDSLPVHGFRAEISRVEKAGLDVCDFNVILDAEHENHDHDMEYLFGQGTGHGKNGQGCEKDGKYVHGEALLCEEMHSHGHGGAHSHGCGEEHCHEHDIEDSHEHGGGHSHGCDAGNGSKHCEEHIHQYDEAHIHEHGEGMHFRKQGEADIHEHGEGVHSHKQGETDIHEHEEGMHSHKQGEAHVHGTAHDHSGHGHHEHRGLPEILEIIGHAEISSRAKETAGKIFRVLAEAESKAHGVPMEQVHFHEVGAVDSIVDIIAVAVCLDNLGITDVIVPYLCEGRGSIRCQHGILPVPVPAVANIVEAHNIPMRIIDMEGELVTPTGAAIAAAVRTSSSLPEQFRIVKTGMGAGKRNYERPSLLRAMLIEATESGKENLDTIYKLETNIDDCTGETLGYVMDKLMKSGARDAYYTPVYMKKNRPAYLLTVICKESMREQLEQIIFRETTTIGIRRIRMERTVLQREMGSVTLRCGELQVKKCILPNGEEKYYPEYETAVKLAQESGMALQQVMDECKRALAAGFSVAYPDAELE